MKRTIFLILMTLSFNVFAEGDPEKGKSVFAICAGCHGAQGQGNDGIEAPRLQGQHDWYLLTQLQNFKSGARGKHEKDQGGQLMSGIIASVDPDNFEHVVAYIMTLEPAPLEE